jgi:hypothetical protein
MTSNGWNRRRQHSGGGTVNFEETTATTNETPQVSDQERQEIVDTVAVDYIPGNKTLFIAAKEGMAQVEAIVRPLDTQLEAEIEQVKTAHYAKHSESYDLLNNASQNLTRAEETLRESLISYYRATGKKTFDEHLSVRVNSKLEYPEAKAVEWARENAPFMIVTTVDKKKFETTVSDLGLDFVTKAEKPSAVIKGL